MRSERYHPRKVITIGRVERKYVFHLCTGNMGWYLHWRGRPHPFQPVEFFNFRDLSWAVIIRLRQAGLYTEGPMAPLPDGTLRVEVLRSRQMRTRPRAPREKLVRVLVPYVSTFALASDI